ncbi:MAG: DUF2171 domain-containing protein [Pseudomonadota bacterium]
MANDRPYDVPNTYDREHDGYGRDFGSGRERGYSSAGDYRTSRGPGDRDDRNFRGGGTGYGGDRGYRPDNGGGRETYGSGNRDYYGGGSSGYDMRGGYQEQRFGGSDNYRGRYAADSHRGFDSEHRDRGNGGRQAGNRDYGRMPQGYDYQDRGFIARAGDEVRSWFGDEDAERRREYDQRYDERLGAHGNTAYGRDSDYHSWRRGQIDALDRDYHEYRQENAKKFENEFGSWRTNRQTQRQSLTQVTEHMEVVGSDGEHVGTIDKVRGDRIILTKTDSDAGGRHHSIPSSWIQSVSDKVTIARTADEAQRQWRDEETSGALFGQDEGKTDRESTRGANLNRSFSGTY